MATVEILRFGEVLRRFRRDRGLTQEALAERAGLSTRAITDLERGVNRSPRADTLRLLAEALRLAPEDRAAFETAARRLDAPSAPTRALLTPEDGQPPFVGRVDELALLERHIAGQGRPLLVLAGEPGIGKSRLLQEAARLGGARGWCVLRGGCKQRGG